MPASTSKPTATEETALATVAEKKAGYPVVSVASEYPILSTSEAELKETMAELFGGEALSANLFDRIKFPTGGNTRFIIPDALNNDNDQEIETLEGVIVTHQTVRTYWAAAYGTTENSAPDCHSDDGRVGQGMYGIDAENPDANPGGMCSTCPMAQWVETDGKKTPPACKLKHVLYIMRPGAMTPTILTLPPTSLKNWQPFVKALFGRQIRLSEAVIKIGLKREGNTKMAFARATFGLVSILPAAEAARMRQYGEDLRHWLSPEDNDDEIGTERQIEAPVTEAATGTTVNDF